MAGQEKVLSDEKRRLFESAPVGKALLTMAIPSIVSQLITMVYNLADTYFIGKSNDPYKVAAATLVGVLYFMLNSLANLFGVGGGSLLSRLLGKKRDQEARNVSSFSFYGSFLLAAVYSLICLIFLEPVTRLLGASENTIEYAKSYLFWVVVVGAIPSTLSITMSHLIRNAGYSKESGFGLTLGGVCNILLDPLFMFVILPKGNEVTGAAVATLLSNVISFGYFAYVYYRLRKKSVLTLSPKAVRISKGLMKEVFAIGLPSAITALLANAVLIIKNNLTEHYGDIELAAYGIVTKIDMLPLNIGMGLCQGMMPLVAYNYASGDYQRMKAFSRAAQVWGMATAFAFIALCQAFAPAIIRLFIQHPQTVSYGTNFLRIACLAPPFMISNFQKIFCLQAMGKGKESLLLGVLRQGAIAIPVLLVLNHFVGLYGVVVSQAVSDGLTFIVSTVLYRKVYKALLLRREEKVPQVTAQE